MDNIEPAIVTSTKSVAALQKAISTCTDGIKPSHELWNEVSGNKVELWLPPLNLIVMTHDTLLAGLEVKTSYVIIGSVVAVSLALIFGFNQTTSHSAAALTLPQIPLSSQEATGAANPLQQEQ